ncbi:pyocin activator PrtN family protein [Burkholderia ubonensis]|uniref:pyocin activator PrtN family protein n=1 Tax=Burkholderia ubonensis TaxID=101571 RepID=UPI00075935EC|nr:pyocin activator PrtN family protein [Burkholderia ubonensis]KVX76267.1 Pyocin activator protein PrtN [Burkholderia ubonensis]
MTETLFFLMAQFGPRAVIPLDEVRKEYFNHLDPQVFIRKLVHGEIPLPVLRIEGSKKTAKGIYMIDLALYIDSRREEVEKERQRLAKIF